MENTFVEFGNNVRGTVIVFIVTIVSYFNRGLCVAFRVLLRILVKVLRVNMASLRKRGERDSIPRMDLGGSIKSHIHTSSSWRYMLCENKRLHKQRGELIQGVFEKCGKPKAVPQHTTEALWGRGSIFEKNDKAKSCMYFTSDEEVSEDSISYQENKFVKHKDVRRNEEMNLKGELSKCHQEIEELQLKIINKEDACSIFESQLAEVKKENDRLQKESAEFARQLSEEKELSKWLTYLKIYRERDIQSLDQKVLKMKELKLHKERELSECHEHIQELKHKLGQKEDACRGFESRLAEVKKENDRLQNKSAEFTRQLSEEKERSRNLADLNSNNEKSIQLLNQKLSKCHQAIQELRHELVQKEDAYSGCVSQLEKHLKEKNQQVEDLTQKLSEEKESTKDHRDMISNIRCVLGGGAI